MICLLFLVNLIPSGSWPDGMFVSCSCKYKDILYFCATKGPLGKTGAFYKFFDKSIEKISNSSVVPSGFSCNGEFFIAGTDDGKIIIYDLTFKERSVTKVYKCGKITCVVAAEENICYFVDDAKKVYRFDISDRSCTVVSGLSAGSLKYNTFDSRMYLIDIDRVVCLDAKKTDEKYRFKSGGKIHNVFLNAKNSNVYISEWYTCENQEFCIEPIINPLITEIDSDGSKCGKYIVDITGEICGLDMNDFGLMCAISTREKMFHFGIFKINDKNFVSLDKKRENIVLTLGSEGFGWRHVMHGGDCAWLTNQSCWFNTNFAKRIMHLDE